MFTGDHGFVPRKPRFSRSARAATVVTLCWLVATVAAHVAEIEDAEPPRRDIDRASIFGRDNNQSVYVADSAVVIEKIALAERMERLQEWSKSAEIYQEIIEQHASKVLPSQLDGDNRIYQYASVLSSIQARLSRWPEAGRRVYLDRYEPQAAQLLSAALPANIPQLHHVLSRYFATQSARDAGMQLVALYLESGDFTAAGWIAARLLDEHQLLTVEQRALLRFQLSLALHLAGDGEAARKQADRLRREHPGVRGVVAGRDVALDETLATLLERTPATASSLASDSWATVFGSSDRSRIPPDGARAMVLTAVVELRPTTPRGAPSDAVREYQRQKLVLGQRGQLNGILPVVDNGELFFQDNARVYAVSLSTGLPLPGWSATYGGEAAGTFATDAFSVPPSTQMAVALTDSEVFAVLGQPDTLALQAGLANPGTGTQLVALDRRSGRKLWSSTLRAAKVPENQARLRELQWIGTPLVVGDNVYVLARGGGSGRQFEESHLVCLRRTDGNFLWATYLASSGTNAPVWGGEDVFGRQTAFSQLAYASGRIYALTNLGGLAAVDAFDGSIVYLNIYPRVVREVDPNLGARRAVRAAGSNKPFSQNPVIVSNGKVFILPSDGDHLMVYDAGSGVEINRLRMSHFGNAHTMLGVVGNTVLLASDQVVFAVDWKKYDRQRYDPSKLDDALRWKSATIAKPNTQGNDSIRGRAFVTEKAVYVPTAWDLRRYSLAGGRLESTYPTEGSWDDDETSGNLLVLPEHLVIAGDTRVCIYTDPSIIRARLDEAEKSHPTDPEPRVRTAEVLFVSGDRDGALSKLDEAIELCRGIEPQNPSPARERVFAASVTFARKLLSDPAGIRSQNKRSDWATGFLDRAALCAVTPEQQVEQRLLRAQLAELTGDVPAQVALLQQILDEPRYRVVPGGAGGSAAMSAETAIDRLIKSAGRSVYAEIEARAARDFAAARDAGDTAALLALADQYPNSISATKGLLEAATLLESSNQPMQAALTFRRLVLREMEDSQRARIHESLARNYLRVPNRREAAVAQLRQAARLAAYEILAKPLLLADGTKIEGVSLAKALATLQASASVSAEQALPDFNLVVVTAQNRDRVLNAEPFGPASARVTIEGVEALLVPLSNRERFDRLVTWSRTALRVLDADTLTPLASVPGIVARPSGCAWQGDTLLVWTDTAIYCIDSVAGAIRWQSTVADLGDIRQLGEDLASSEGETDNTVGEPGLQARRARVAMINRLGAPAPPAGAAEQIAHLRLSGDRIVLNTSTGRLATLQLSNGAVAWQTRFGQRPGRLFDATDDFVVALLQDERLTNLVAIDLVRGQLVHRRTVAHEGMTGIANFALGTDGTLVYLTADRIVGKDLHDPSGKPTFQTDRSNTEAGVFSSTVNPGQLVIADGRVLVVAFANMPQQSVRGFSLTDGKPLKFIDPKTRRETTARFNPEAGNAVVSIRVVGERLYLVGQRTLVCYNLETGVKEWARHAGGRRSNWTMRALFFGRDYLIAIDDIGNLGVKLQINCYNRTRLPDGPESGTYDYAPELETPVGFALGEWQPINGGLALRTKQDKLIVLRGQRGK